MEKFKPVEKVNVYTNELNLKLFQVWKDYFPAVDAIVFLIDCVDRARFPESKVELDSLLTDDQLSNCPVVILGNKVATVHIN